MNNNPQILGLALGGVVFRGTALDEIRELVEKAGTSSLEVLKQKFKCWLES